jgi:protein AbiQ
MIITWKIVNEYYLDYLRDNYESRIPYSNYGEDKYKPFFSPLFKVGELVYITQISHPQKRHYELKRNIDFYKIYHPNDGRLLAVINLNYMFPIHNSLMADLRYKSIENYRSFKDDEEKSKYIDLLKIELEIINKLPLQKNAFKIYNMKYDYPNNYVSQRCFDFKSLEEGCREYLKEQ